MPISDSQVRTMATLYLEYGPAMQESVKFAQKVKDVEIELAKLQARLSNLSQASAKGILVPDLSIVKASVTDMQKLVASGEQLGDVGLQNLATAKRFVDLQTPLVAAKRSELEVSKQINDEAKKGQTFWERRFGWFVAGSIFYGTLKAAREVVDNLKKIEEGMVTIQRVSQEPLADFGKMQQDLLSLGVEFGQVWSVVSDVATRWAQAGYNVRDTIELTRTSLLALNTAELNSTQATQGMIAIMAQWGLQAEQLLPTLDKINRTADSYAVSSADLIDGLSRSSGAAKMLGMDIEQTIAILTVLRESSGRTGREVGNALNSILAFMQRPGAIKAMQGVGIDVWADATHTKLRNVMDVFSDIASRWPSMDRVMQDSFANAAEQAGLYAQEISDIVTKTDEFTQAQSREIATADAGTYRRNYFMALMSNFGKVMGVVTNMENSFGYSMNENQKAMDTYAKKVYQLQASWEAFSTAFAQTGLLDQLKFLTDTGRGVLKVFNDMPAPVKAATGAVLEYAAALSLVRLAQKTFGLGTFGDLLKSGSQAGFLAAETTVLTKFSTTLTTFFSSMAFKISLLVAAGAALWSLYKQYQEYNKTLEEGAKYYEEASRSGQDMTTTLNNLGRRLPELILEFDKEGNVVKFATDKLIEHKRALGDLPKGADDAKKKLESLTEQFNNLEKTSPPSWWTQFAFFSGFSPNVAMGGEYAKPFMKQQLAKDIEATKQDVDAYNSAVIRAYKEYAAIRSTGGTWSGIEPADFEFAKLRYEGATEAVLDHELALIQVRKSLSLVDIEMKSLNDTLEDAKRNEELVSQKAALMNQENQLLANSNSNLNDRLVVLNDLLGQAASAISILGEGTERSDWIEFQKRIRSEIQSTTQEIADNTIQMRENTLEIKKGGHAVQEYFDKVESQSKKAYDAVYDASKRAFEHQVKMLGTSTEMQIQHYRNLMEIYKNDQEKRWSLEERLQDLYRDLLKEQTDRVKEAYKERLDALKDSMDKEIKAVQDKIDAIDAIEERSDRSEAARQHANKIKEIEEKLAYERLRTGIEHERNIIDLTKQMEEENIRWQRQQEQWSRDDRKEALRKEIDDIRESYAKRQKELEDAWAKAEKFLTGEFSTILATAAVYDQSWYQKGVDWASKLAAGFAGGMSASGISNLIGSIGGSVSQAGQQTNIRSNTAALLAAKKAWERANAIGDVEGMREAAARGQAIRAAGPTLDPNNQYSASELEDLIRRSSFDTGGLALTGGWAKLHPGELVLKADLSTDILKNLRGVTSTNKTVYNINSPLVKFEKVEVKDRTDANYIIDTVDRHIKDIIVSKGGRTA